MSEQQLKPCPLFVRENGILKPVTSGGAVELHETSGAVLPVTSALKEAEKPDDDLRNAFERRFRNQGKKPDEAKKLADLAARPAGKKPSFFSGRAVDPTELKERV